MEFVGVGATWRLNNDIDGERRAAVHRVEVRHMDGEFAESCSPGEPEGVCAVAISDGDVMALERVGVQNGHDISGQ